VLPIQPVPGSIVKRSQELDAVDLGHGLNSPEDCTSPEYCGQ
jgi:hypothetical protein